MPEKKKKPAGPMKRANKTGSVYNLGLRRRNPWRAVGWVGGKRITIGYYPHKSDALEALALNSSAPISQKSNYTLKQLYDEMK
jgi:hypothetical protein